MMSKQWLKLDNAATIYPAQVRRNYAAMFRFTVTLNEDVDKKVLQQALDNVMQRFPNFHYRLRQGLFWCYFDYINNKPFIQEDYKNPLFCINWEKNRHFMFRVRVFNKRIALEVFHALTDGTGGLIFLLSLTGEYLRLKHDIKIKYNEWVKDPLEKFDAKEMDDLFFDYARGSGALEKEKAAFHIKGTTEKAHILNIITGKMSITDLKVVCKKYDCTITEFLVAMLIYSYQDIEKREYKNNKKPIKVSVPVNLRKIYNVSSMRNFSSYVNVGIESSNNILSLEVIIKIVQEQMKLLTSEEKLNDKFSANVKLMKNYFIRRIPMFVKKYVISIIEATMGDGYITTLLSNIGLVNLPKEMDKYVEEMNFILGRSRFKPGSVACVGYKDKLYLSFSRKIKEAELERVFFTNLVEMGILVEVESNGC